MEALLRQSVAVTPTLGFRRCWSLSIGTLVCSGVFLPPVVLAPYGRIGFLGWMVAGAGALLIALAAPPVASRVGDG